MDVVLYIGDIYVIVLYISKPPVELCSKVAKWCECCQLG